MTGIFDGIGNLIAISMAIVIGLPYVILLTIYEFGYLERFRLLFKLPGYAITYVLLVFLSIVAIRLSIYSIYWLSVIFVISTAIYLIKLFKRIRNRS